MAVMDPLARSILAELRRRFETLYGDRLARMILYGSQARGDARQQANDEAARRTWRRPWRLRRAPRGVGCGSGP